MKTFLIPLAIILSTLVSCHSHNMEKRKSLVSINSHRSRIYSRIRK